MTAQDLADGLKAEGVHWERATVAKLENGIRENVTVGELLALSVVLGIAPVYLLLPEDDRARYQVTPAREESTATARKFIRGSEELPGMDWRTFMAEMPETDVIEYVAGRKRHITELNPEEENHGDSG